MNPVFSLNYSEFLVADHLQNLFRKKEGYSLLLPLSGQQKGYDIALMHRQSNSSKVVTFQVKGSRSYEGSPGTAPISGRRTFAHNMYLNAFSVPAEADFFVFISQYPSNRTNLRQSTNLWSSHMLLFSQKELAALMKKLRKKKTNTPETHFNFGFDKSNEAFLTRGHADAQHPDYSAHVLANNVSKIQNAL